MSITQRPVLTDQSLLVITKTGNLPSFFLLDGLLDKTLILGIILGRETDGELTPAKKKRYGGDPYS